MGLRRCALRLSDVLTRLVFRADCGTTESSWVCLVCGRMGCSRYISGHAKKHYETTQHALTFEINTKLCYWCAISTTAYARSIYATCN